jgi:TolB protein
MKRLKLIGLAAIFIMGFSLWCGLIITPVHSSTIQFNETQITSNSASQENPDVYGGIIVWQDNRNGNWDIYMYAPRLNMWDPEIQITTDPANQMNPRIFQKTIVYESFQNGNWDIYLYNITSGVETQITANPYAQMSPKIDGDYIVWEDNRNGKWDVYMYELITQTEYQITTASADSIDPSMSGNRIVYVRNIGSGGAGSTLPYVYYYDLSTGNEVQLETNSRSFRYAHVAIDETCVAWTKLYIGTYGALDYDIRMRDITTGIEWQTSSTRNQEHADISGAYPWKYIVYDDDRNGKYDIYMYMLASGTEERVTTNAANQRMPAIFSGVDEGWWYNAIVYMDDRNSNWDIYLNMFGWVAAPPENPPAPKPLTPSLVISQLQEIKSRIGDVMQFPTSYFAGANNKVKENRRNAMIHQLDSAIANIEAAAYTQNLKLRSKYCQSAIDQLNDLINKVDGWSLRGSADMPGSSFTPDWITYPSYMDQMIRSYRNNLQTLLNGIT